jgi:hypothetical protein
MPKCFCGQLPEDTGSGLSPSLDLAGFSNGDIFALDLPETLRYVLHKLIWRVRP